MCTTSTAADCRPIPKATRPFFLRAPQARLVQDNAAAAQLAQLRDLSAAKAGRQLTALLARFGPLSRLAGILSAGASGGAAEARVTIAAARAIVRLAAEPGLCAELRQAGVLPALVALARAAAAAAAAAPAKTAAPTSDGASCSAATGNAGDAGTVATAAASEAAPATAADAAPAAPTGPPAAAGGSSSITASAAADADALHAAAWSALAAMAAAHGPTAFQLFSDGVMEIVRGVLAARHGASRECRDAATALEAVLVSETLHLCTVFLCRSAYSDLT